MVDADEFYKEVKGSTDIPCGSSVDANANQSGASENKDSEHQDNTLGEDYYSFQSNCSIMSPSKKSY